MELGLMVRKICYLKNLFLKFYYNNRSRRKRSRSADHVTCSNNNIAALLFKLDQNLKEVLDMAGSLSDQDLPEENGLDLSESDRITSN